MAVIRSTDAVAHQIHGASFTSYAAPARGSRELCAWRLDIPPGTDGIAHRVTREEVLCLLSGTLQAVVDGETSEVSVGDVLLVPAGSVLRISNQATAPAAAWVTTSTGLAAVLPDGSWLTPPWAS